MAKVEIQKLTRVEKQTNRIHEEVRATFTTFVYNGVKYFQIDTYGSNNRECTEKISQSFQIEAESAKALIDLLKKEFGD